MIIKRCDANRARIKDLELRLIVSTNDNERWAIKHIIARLRSDSTSAEACQLIDEQFGGSKDWVILHDLRIKFGTQIVHLNHLLINNYMEFFCLDTRYINHGMTITNEGACYAVSGQSSQLIKSPIRRMQRSTLLVNQLLKQSDILPKKFGIKKPSCVTGYILTHSSKRIERPSKTVFDSAAVISHDSLFPVIWQEPLHWIRKMIKPMDESELKHVGKAIASLHYSLIDKPIKSAPQANETQDDVLN
ncbi:MAG: NERD domain-containing protein [Gammaproteobacteria bacterium]|nr:NERD domain-containing protein [Gammaproteobacteria bacterium]